MAEFRWTTIRARAAEMLADDHASDEQIADELHISRSQLSRWKKQPAFAARVSDIVAAQQAALLADGIVQKQNRVQDLNELRTKLLTIIEQRKDSPLTEGAAGGETGLLVAEPMLIKIYESNGEDGDDLSAVRGASKIVYKLALDTGLIRALLDVEKQAAIELGQWEEKSHVSGSVLIREYGVALDQV